MGTVTKLNDVLCANISKVDDILKANASKWDDNSFCPSGPTPTPTPTPTVTPTPTPTPTCVPDCCFVEVCVSDECTNACACIEVIGVYLHLPCGGDCILSNADGVFQDSRCGIPEKAGLYFSDGADCYYWDGSTLSYQGPC